jgi:hypothetical protein
MSGIDSEMVAYGTSLIRVTFADDIGNVKTITGTGFWLAFDSERPIFITNRHNLDPKMKLGSQTRFGIHKLEIMLRKVDRGVWQKETDFFEIHNPIQSIHLSPNADCAAIANFSWEYRKSDFMAGIVTMKSEEIADQNFFETKLKMMDHISFVGFPGPLNAPWWDTGRNLPIARSASISSLPQFSYANSSVKTQDVTLVTGMSFGGSSGSPVFSLQKGYPLAGGGDNEHFAPPKLIGIMSGHFEEESQTPPIFRHSGLSYYTRSTSIIALLSTICMWP